MKMFYTEYAAYLIATIRNKKKQNDWLLAHVSFPHVLGYLKMANLRLF